MNLRMKDFQIEHVQILLDRIRRAKRYVEDGQREAVILSAPTGSGKTVMLTAVIEAVVFGTDEFPAENDAVFLWLSDQPELNEQSRSRIAASSDRLTDNRLVVIDNTFDRDVFEGGRVYFLNTQKLARNSLLVSPGDNRSYSIWETIEATARNLGDRFYVVIDEAHRGMAMSAQSRNEANSIVQKFLLGSPSDGLTAIPLVLGISATPVRFEDLVGQTDRHLFKVVVDVEQVRDSGLLKDRLLVQVPKENSPSDWTLLKHAAERWQRMKNAWAQYCQSQGLPVVSPILVVQVEDGSGAHVTATNLETALGVLSEVIADLRDEHLAHAFQDAKNIRVGDRVVRHIEPSRIDGDSNVRVVFFKMALSTGWDCPRAEVIMSFRRAQDPTAIAQLVGRMVRNPLGRRVEGNDVLNSVRLLLPYYNKVTVASVIENLSKDTESVPPLNVEDDDNVVEASVSGSFLESWKLVNGKPSYLHVGTRTISNLVRLLRFATNLAMDDIDAGAPARERDGVVDLLQKLAHELIAKDKGFASQLTGAAKVSITTLAVMNDAVSVETDENISISSANAEDLYKQAKRGLGEFVVVEFMRREIGHDPVRAKLLIYLLSRREDVTRRVEEVCQGRIEELRRRHHESITRLSSSQQLRYQELWALAKSPEPQAVWLPEVVQWTVSKGSRPWPRHLYQGEESVLQIDLNPWEEVVVEELLRESAIECWLRNLPRKSWSLAYWYEKSDGSYAPGFPDILAVRGGTDGRVLEVYEPHSPHLSDGWRKAKGLARYADRHLGQFGRLAICRIIDGSVRLVDFCHESVRQEGLRLNGDADLDNLFRRYGTPIVGGGNS